MSARRGGRLGAICRAGRDFIGRSAQVQFHRAAFGVEDQQGFPRCGLGRRDRTSDLGQGALRQAACAQEGAERRSGGFWHARILPGFK
jgi:hypothetical protein